MSAKTSVCHQMCGSTKVHFVSVTKISTNVWLNIRQWVIIIFYLRWSSKPGHFFGANQVLHRILLLEMGGSRGCSTCASGRGGARLVMVMFVKRWFSLVIFVKRLLSLVMFVTRWLSLMMFVKRWLSLVMFVTIW